MRTNLLWVKAAPRTSQPNDRSHNLPVQYESNFLSPNPARGGGLTGYGERD